jgi:hypothetical protein
VAVCKDGSGVEYYHVDCRPLRLEPPRSKNWQIVTVDYFNPTATLIFK